MGSKRGVISFFLFLFIISALTTSAYHALRSDWVLWRKGEGYFQRKEYSKAIPIYFSLLQKGFQSASAYRHLEESLLACEDGAGNLSSFEMLVEREPQNLRALSMLAGLYVRTGRFDKAILSYQRLLRAQPGYRDGRVYLARLLSWEGRYEEAVVEYRKVLGERG